jgi:lysozyme family protein
MIHALIENIIEREGGFVNHKDDKGGPTNMGVTMATLAEYRNRPVTLQDVKDLSIAEVRQIYYGKYWVKSKFSLLNLASPVEELLLDSAVHHGVHGATKLLQRAVMTKPDGKIGPITLNVVNAMPSDRLCAALVAQRVMKFGRLITNDPTQSVFAAGWMNRMKPFIESIVDL